MLRNYFAGNIMTNSQNRDGFISLQSLALAYLAGVRSGTMTITQRDANRAGFMVHGFPLFFTAATKDNVRAQHPQYDVNALTLETKIVGQTSRVILAAKQFAATDVHERHAIVARHNARREKSVTREGVACMALHGLLPRADCLEIAIQAHDGTNDERTAAWCNAVRWLNANPTALHL